MHRVSVARDETPVRQTVRTLATILVLGIPSAIGLAVSALIGTDRTKAARARVPLVGLGLALFVGFAAEGKALSMR